MKKKNISLSSGNASRACISKACNSVIPDFKSVLQEIRKDKVPAKTGNEADETPVGLLNAFRPTYFSKSGMIVGYAKTDNQAGFPFAFDLEKEYCLVLHVPEKGEKIPELFIVSPEAILKINAAAPENEIHPIFRALALKTIYVHDLKTTLGSFVKLLGNYILPRRIIDTSAAATILFFNQPHGKKHPDLTELLKAYIRPKFIPEHLLAEYTKPEDIAIHQAMSLPYLHRELITEIKRRFGSAESAEIENSFSAEIIRIENAGVPVNVASLKPRLAELEEQRASITAQSNPCRHIKERNKIKELLKPIIPEISFLRFFTTTRNGRVFGTFNPYSCPSGRISIPHSYLQGIRREYKDSIYKAPEGRSIISADLPASQLRIAATITGDEELIQAIITGKDLHRQTAAKILKKDESKITDDERQIGKTANFQLLFGTGAESFKEELEEKTGKSFSLRDVGAMIKAFRQGYPAVARWQDGIAELFNKEENGGGAVRTLSGKQIYVTEYNKALNYAIAGSEAEILKKAVVSFATECRDRGIDAQIINLIHDNIVVETAIEDKEDASMVLKESVEMAINMSLKLFLTEVKIETMAETPAPVKQDEEPTQPEVTEGPNETNNYSGE